MRLLTMDMGVFLTKRFALAFVTSVVILAGSAMTTASAQYHHGHGYYDRYGRYHRGYYGPPRYYGDGYYYRRPGCLPVLGIVSGDFCGY